MDSLHDHEAIAFLRSHRAHDFDQFTKAWKEALRGTGYALKTIGNVDDFPIHMVSNKVKGQGGLYVSAGIHGDEPAGPWGLLEWFKQGGHRRFAEVPLVILPCLNPFGLRHNSRGNAKNQDLNRLFNKSTHSPISEVRAMLEGRKFRLGICLHEDFDGQGIYLYDLNNSEDQTSARHLLFHAASLQLPIDQRSEIDGRKSQGGVISRRKADLEKIPGLPEAVFLFLRGHVERSLTFETPSEFSFYDRVQAQKRFLDHACALALDPA